MATDTDLSRLKGYVNSESTEIKTLDTVQKPLTASPLKVTSPLSWRQTIRRRLSWRETIRRRLHPYASLISFLGIAIPLGLFLIKDVVCDRRKESLESLETARTRLMLMQNINDLKSTTDHVVGDLHEVLGLMLKRPPEQMKFTSWSNSLRGKLDVIASMEALCAQLPSDFPDRKTYNSECRGLEQKANQIKSTYGELWKDYKSNGARSVHDGISGTLGLEEKYQKFPDQNKRTMDGIDKDLDNLKSTVESEKSRLDKSFEEETIHMTHHLRTWTYLSWALYPVGVLITLLGGLTGIKIPGAE